jgi:hypothetical protein
LVPLLGVALTAAAGETANPPASLPATELSAANNPAVTSQPSAALSMADQQSLQKVGERIALSGALTKTPPSKAGRVGQLFNPLAPVKPQAQTRWLERTAWSTAATAAVANPAPLELRHEPRFGLMIAGR